MNYCRAAINYILSAAGFESSETVDQSASKTDEVRFLKEDMESKEPFPYSSPGSQQSEFSGGGHQTYPNLDDDRASKSISHGHTQEGTSGSLLNQRPQQNQFSGDDFQAEPSFDSMPQQGQFSEPGHRAQANFNSTPQQSQISGPETRAQASFNPRPQQSMFDGVEVSASASSSLTHKDSSTVSTQTSCRKDELSLYKETLQSQEQDLKTCRKQLQCKEDELWNCKKTLQNKEYKLKMCKEDIQRFQKSWKEREKLEGKPREEAKTAYKNFFSHKVDVFCGNLEEVGCPPDLSEDLARKILQKSYCHSKASLVDQMEKKLLSLFELHGGVKDEEWDYISRAFTLMLPCVDAKKGDIVTDEDVDKVHNTLHEFPEYGVADEAFQLKNLQIKDFVRQCVQLSRKLLVCSPPIVLDMSETTIDRKNGYPSTHCRKPDQEVIIARPTLFCTSAGDILQGGTVSYKNKQAHQQFVSKHARNVEKCKQACQHSISQSTVQKGDHFSETRSSHQYKEAHERYGAHSS